MLYSNFQIVLQEIPGEVSIYFTITGCDHIDKKTLQKCGKCDSFNIDYGTRVIGYLKRVASFSTSRHEEHKLRFYHILESIMSEKIRKERLMCIGKVSLESLSIKNKLEIK